jgi:hypothetical protein
MALPPCGFYQTTLALGSIGIGQLVYFHNHGDPGPGIYLPLSWQHNRVQWNTAGHTIPDEAFAASLKCLEPEGLFVVKTAFYCCEKSANTFTRINWCRWVTTAKPKASFLCPSWALKASGFLKRAP